MLMIYDALVATSAGAERQVNACTDIEEAILLTKAL